MREEQKELKVERNNQLLTSNQKLHPRVLVSPLAARVLKIDCWRFINLDVRRETFWPQ